MKVLLANPPCLITLPDGSEKGYFRAGSRWPASFIRPPGKTVTAGHFPFFLAYAAAVLEQEPDIDVYGHDSILLNYTEDEFIEYVGGLKPDLVFFEMPSSTADKDYHLAANLKRALPKSIVAVGGAHPSVFPKEVLCACPDIDFCLLREYELNLRDLVRSTLGRVALENVKGIAFRRNGEVVVREGELIDPLDLLPPPARHLFPSKDNPGVDKYWEVFAQSFPLAQMHASRGCPFRCNFCLWNQVMYGNGKYRTFSPARVVDEMLDCVEKYKVREIYFDDDTFTGNRRHVLNLCEEMVRRGVPKVVAWSAMADAMVTDEEMVNRMADAGCIGLKFGVESGSEEILHAIGKPLKLEKTLQFVRWCARRHIKTHATFTFGLEGDTKETMRKTLDFALELDSDSSQFSISTPYPGTRYYDSLKEKNMLLTTRWSDFDGHCSSVVRFENMDSDEVMSIFHRSHKAWLRRKLSTPSWVWRQVYNWNRLRRRHGFRYAWDLLLRIVRGAA